MATTLNTSSQAFNAKLKASLDAIPQDTYRMVSLSFAISDRIAYLLVKKRISRADFAKAMGKQKSEITTWLSGQQNFTLKTIAKIEAFFGEHILDVAPAHEVKQPPSRQYVIDHDQFKPLLLAEPTKEEVAAMLKAEQELAAKKGLKPKD